MAYRPPQRALDRITNGESEPLSNYAQANRRRKLYPSEELLLKTIREAGDKGITLSELVESSYRGVKDGGPMDPEACIRQRIHHIKKKTGLAIEREAVYRIRP